MIDADKTKEVATYIITSVLPEEPIQTKSTCSFLNIKPRAQRHPVLAEFISHNNRTKIFSLNYSLIQTNQLANIPSSLFSSGEVRCKTLTKMYVVDSY
jgi:hypothetical protein